MWFVTLVKFRKKITKADADAQTARMKEAEKSGFKIHHAFWTIGQYDAIIVSEAPDLKTIMRVGIGAGEHAKTETLAAVSRDEAISWLS